MKIAVRRFRANMAHAGQSRTDSGFGFQFEVSKTFQVVSSPLGSGSRFASHNEGMQVQVHGRCFDVWHTHGQRGVAGERVAGAEALNTFGMDPLPSEERPTEKLSLFFNLNANSRIRSPLCYMCRDCSAAACERLVIYCQTASTSTAPCTPRRMYCPTHCASHWAPCQPLLRAFSGWAERRATTPS